MSWSEVKKVNSNLNTPLNEGGVKIVKSVQRGFLPRSSGTTSYSYNGVYFYTKTLSINEVNPEKSIILINGSNDNSGYFYVSAVIENNNTIRIFSGSSNSLGDQRHIPNTFWLVIEFY